jgi:hypothetical protein
VTASSSFKNHAAKLFVWSIIVVMAAIDLYYLLEAGRNIPINEDWTLVAPVTGHEPNFFQWLWSQNDEHRVPLPRFIFYLLLKITKDFRSGMALNILTLTLR